MHGTFVALLNEVDYIVMGTAPESATSATRPGEPGDGGKGGTIHANVNIQNLASYAKGLAGTADTTLHQGGKAGNPTPVYYKALGGREWGNGIIGGISQRFDIQTHNNNDGTSVTTQDLKYGKDGSDGHFIDLKETSTSWFHPQSARLTAIYFRDCFLRGHLDPCTLRDMRYFVHALDLFAAETAQDTTLHTEWKTDMAQAREDVRSMLSRYRSNLDYFGHPKGWFPLLSFEVAYSSYEKEIDSALNILYLDYWISGKQDDNVKRLEALNRTKECKWNEYINYRKQYKKAISQRENLQLQARQNAIAIKNNRDKLEVLDFRIQRQAEENVNPAWKQVASAICKTTATICYFIPHPAAQIIAPITDAGSDLLEAYNPAAHDWADIGGAMIGTAGEFMDAYAQTETGAMNFQSQIESFGEDRQEWFRKKSGHIGKLQSATTGLKNISESISQFSKSYENSIVPSPEIQAETERLRLANPEFQKLKKQSEALLTEREKLAQEILKNTQDIQQLPVEMTACLLTLDAINDATQHTTLQTLSSRTATAVRDMRRRAEERLLRYHYYMGKAFEYRALKPYDWNNLNVDNIRKECERLAKEEGNVSISPEKFKTLKGFYEDILSRIKEAIINTGLEVTQTRIPLTKSVIDDVNKLNIKESVAFNLHNLSDFSNAYQKLRIVYSSDKTELPGINIADDGVKITLEGADKDKVISAKIIFTLIHSGRSRLLSTPESFEFYNFNPNINADSPTVPYPIRWSFTYQYIRGEKYPVITRSRPSPSTTSLISHLLTDGQRPELFSYPGLDAEIYFEVTDIIINFEDGTTSGDARMKLEKVLFDINYEYAELNPEPGKVSFSTLKTDTLPAIPSLYNLSVKDEANRQNGTRSFRRIFAGTPTNIKLTAPETVGNAKFIKWVTNGSEVVGSNETTLILTRDNPYRKISALYAAYNISGSITRKNSPTEVILPMITLALTQNGQKVRQINTIDNGSYGFNNLEPGTYVITPTLHGAHFYPEERTIVIPVEEAVSITNLDFTVEYPPCTINGKLVATASSIKLNEAIVKLYREDDDSFVMQVNPSDDGTFMLPNLPTGSYIVKPSHLNCSFTPVQSKTVKLTEKQPSASVQFQAHVATPPSEGGLSL